MRLLEKYTGTKTYMAPSGALMTPERMLESFPAIMTFTHVIETDKNGQICLAINNLSMMRDRYNIDDALTDDEAIAEIQTIINAERNPLPRLRKSEPQRRQKRLRPARRVKRLALSMRCWGRMNNE